MGKRLRITIASLASILVGLAFACGDSLSLDALPQDGGTTDGAAGTLGDGAATNEGATDPGTFPGCDRQKPFGAPERVKGLPDGVWSARFSADEKTVYAQRSIELKDQLVVATRSSVTDAFGSVAPLATWSPTTSERAPSVTAAGDVLFFESVSATNATQIWTSGRADSGWAAPTQIRFDTSSDVSAPYVQPNGSALYFDVSAELSRKIEVSSLLPPAEAQLTSKDVSEKIDNGMFAGFPVVTGDGSAIYFARGVDADHFTVFVAEAGSKGFTDEAVAVDLGTDGTKSAPSWISPDGCRLYFSSDRSASSGGVSNGVMSAWVATRPPSAVP